MPTSFNKKELEKKKVQKRKDKQQRKIERKAVGSKSFDDMIAYVDENGIITDLPPDTGNKTEIETGAILISIPKKDEKEDIN
jgi:peptidyl-tRNA hydrolase